MITLIGYVYFEGRPVFSCPLYYTDARNGDPDYCCSATWISINSSFVSLLKEPTELSGSFSPQLRPSFLTSQSVSPISETTAEKTQSDHLLESSLSLTKLPSKGFSEPKQISIEQWSLHKYKLTLYNLLYVFKEIQRCKPFRRSIVKKELIPKQHRKTIHALVLSEDHLDLIVKFQVSDCQFAPIDWSGNRLILALVSAKLRVEETLSILSTLGGAYSSLGEHYIHFAIKAGETSIKQIGLACITGDPTVIARCGIYMVYSLCQRGMFRRARRLMINFIHPYITSMILKKTCDNIIRNMYKAAKFRVEYYHRP